jgi:undecaprenyl phosphate-alpha-L-ara4FN deformylase
MWRSRAARLYGWDILFRGLLTRGPLIGKRLAAVIRQTANEGHEVGLHAWDHFGWQSAALTSRASLFIAEDLRRGVEEFQSVVGRPPDCSAAPAWLGTREAVKLKAAYPFRYNSDCRGESIFRPTFKDADFELQPQIPTTLPVYDEVIGRNGLADDGYNRFLLAQLRPGRLNVLTIHAEAEGIAVRELFDRFLGGLRDLGFGAKPLGALLDETAVIPAGRVELRSIPGRQGVVAMQVDLEGDARAD